MKICECSSQSFVYTQHKMSAALSADVMKLIHTIRPCVLSCGEKPGHVGQRKTRVKHIVSPHTLTSECKFLPAYWQRKKCAFSRQHPAAIKLQEKSCLLHSMQTWNIGRQQSMRLDADPWIKVQISSWTVQEALRGNNQLWTWPWVFLVNCLMTLSQKLKYTALILGFSGHLHISVQSKVLT